MFRKRFWFVLLFLGVATVGAAGAESGEKTIDGPTAFERIKTLAGRWEGHLMKEDGPEGAVEYRVTAGGHTVFEVLFPDTEHEMVTAYYLDGSELRAKHFCTMGNQPEMTLDTATSSPSELQFRFVGGTNLDPEHDAHIHGGRIRIGKGDRLESEWFVYENGAPSQTNRFLLSRKE